MTYFQYMFSDKKAAIYWLIILIAILIFPVVALSGMGSAIDELEVPDILRLFMYLIIYVVIYIGFYTSGYIKYRLQKKFTDNNNIHINHIFTVPVEIHQDKFTIKPYRMNYDVKIKVTSHLDYFSVCVIDKTLVLMGKVYDFGIFRRHMKPIQIDTGELATDRLQFVSKPAIKELIPGDNVLIVKFAKSINSINKLIIMDYTKILTATDQTRQSTGS